MKLAKLTRSVPFAALLLCAAGANAQMYKWVDSKGVTHFSDTPPPDSKKTEVKAAKAGAELVPLPYALVSATRVAPVTLYTAPDCKGCDEGRKLLNARGIPFAEKTVNTYEDHMKLKEVGSEGQLPTLVVGRAKVIGFQPDGWNSALTNASYPVKNMLPARYRNAPAVAAAPLAAPAAPAADTEREAREAAKAADAEAERARAARAKKKSEAPPGFQF